MCRENYNVWSCCFTVPLKEKKELKQGKYGTHSYNNGNCSLYSLFDAYNYG